MDSHMRDWTFVRSADFAEAVQDDFDDSDAMKDATNRLRRMFAQPMEPVCDERAYASFSHKHYREIQKVLLYEEWKPAPEKNREGTLLHSLVGAIAALTRTDRKRSPWKASAKLILDVAKDIGVPVLRRQKPGTKDTCLHDAIGYRADGDEFVDFICCVADEHDLCEAIEILDGQYRSCIQLVIERVLDSRDLLNDRSLQLLDQLVCKARPEALGIPSGKRGKDDHEVGNLPLHDLAHIRLSKSLVSLCPNEKNACQKCGETKDPLAISEAYHQLYLRVLKRMATKYPAAIKKLNNDNMSPFLFHTHTRNADTATKSWGQLEFPAVAAGPIGPLKGDIVDQARSTSARIAPKQHGLGISFETKKPVVAFDVQSVEVLEHGDRRTVADDEKHDSASATSTHQKPEVRLSKALASDVANTLLDLSLSQGSFDDACDALFGKRSFGSEFTFTASPLTNKTINIHKNLPMEPMLACVELTLDDSAPHLASEASHQDRDGAQEAELSARGQREKRVMKFFDWLRRERGVKRIISLVVNDHPRIPCRDNVIRFCLNGFDIRYLDWDKEDLCIDILTETAPNVQELGLVWSGRASTLHGWANTESGLRTLRKLRQLNININPGWEDDDTNRANFDAFRRTLACQDNMSSLRIRNPFDEDDRLNDTAAPLELHGTSEQTGNHWLEAVEAFRKALTNKVKKDARHSLKGAVKVAIIDDGVDLDSLDITEYVVGGWHPVHRTPSRRRMNPWYTSENKHGTQMAKLVQLVCPFVSLYVAKLDTKCRVYKSVAASAVVAIEKAIENGVNVIPISWTIYKDEKGDNEADIKRLQKAIEKAAEHNILVYCAAEDIGHTSIRNPYPTTDCNPLIMKRVGSATAYGEKAEYVDCKKIDYLFPGEIATQRQICSGSWAATALAAGLTGLILWCSALQNLGMATDKVAKTATATATAATAIATATATSAAAAAAANTKTKRGPDAHPPPGSPAANKRVDSLPLDASRAATLTDWNPDETTFQTHKRMYGLFDTLRSSDENPLVDITRILHTAAVHPDPARRLVELCRADAHKFFE